MTQKEFKENVDELFKEFEIYEDIAFKANPIKINENHLIEFFSDMFFIVKIENDHIIAIYTSEEFDNYETYFDELIIFKELILPKYL